MFLTDETYRAVIVAAIQSKSPAKNVDEVIKATVDALIAADRKIVSYENGALEASSEAH